MPVLGGEIDLSVNSRDELIGLDAMDLSVKLSVNVAIRGRGKLLVVNGAGGEEEKQRRKLREGGMGRVELKTRRQDTE